jgi:hypothetical protein
MIRRAPYNLGLEIHFAMFGDNDYASVAQPVQMVEAKRG